jgi:fatty-acyl-CoA synthase
MIDRSYAKGLTDVGLLHRTIGQALDQARAQWSDGLALVSRHQGVRWSWRELADEADRVACGLLAAGVNRGGRVAIWSPNSSEWTVLQLATARVGAILVNINPAYRTAEVEYALNKVECSILVTAPSFKSSDYIGMLRELLPKRLPHLNACFSTGPTEYDGFRPWSSLRELPDPAQLVKAGSELSPDQPINVQFTSGTTGSPKGATLTHHNILNNGYFVGRRLGLDSHDKVCIPVPLYHCFGMVMGNLACLTHGAAMVYPDGGFDPLAVLQAVDAERCTALYGVPTMFMSVLNHSAFEAFDLSSLRTGIMAGSPCPETTMREVMERMHMSEVTIAYGMTETSPVSCQTGRDDPLAERITTVGRIQPHLEMKVVAADGEIVPTGVPGELCTRGYSVMQGYWGEPELTAEAIDPEGWMHTGDLGTLDAAGYFRVTGRLKDMLIRGGENIYPLEIEEFLMRHPAVADVQVVGIPDEKFGEEVCACIVTKDGMIISPDEIRDFCRGQIAHYKVPRHVVLVTEFPLTTSGKVQKYLLREQAVSLLAGPFEARLQ